MAADARFPADFLWGAATAAYQIEGSPLADGAGDSIWHRFSHTPGTVRDGDTGDVACDHYNRWREDVDLMRELGLNAYRFSIAWPRVIPSGAGRVNDAGLDFYDRLVDALLAAGIRPFVTLYHWDLPGALQDLGGWANRDIAEWFAAYADAVARRLGDRVKDWITLNEPWVVAVGGHLAGILAPGQRDLWATLRATHNLLRAHGAAVPAVRAAAPGARVGITLNVNPVHPASDSDDDAEARDHYDQWLNRQYLDPLFRRTYPEWLTGHLGAAWPPVLEGDLDAIAAPIDFLGVNCYSRTVVASAPGQGPLGLRTVAPEGAEYTDTEWEVYPNCLPEILTSIHRDYAPRRLYITENGAAFADEAAADGSVSDERRESYLRDHLAAAGRAVAEGVPLAGYFVWSLLDNFEWSHGYSKRFGIVRVDYETQRRTIKQSGRWYSGFIAGQER